MQRKLYSIYTQSACIYCDAAKDLLKEKQLPFTEYNIEDNPEYKKELLEMAPNAKTVPQIFVRDKLIGGYDDFKQYVEEAISWH